MSRIEKSIEKAARMRGDLTPAPKQETSRAENFRFYLEEGEKRVHLRDYLDVLLRRKWIAIVFLISVVTIATLVSFLMKPLYKATATIQIKNENPSILTFKNIYQGTTPEEEYYETQYNILKSRSLAKRIIAKLPREKETKFVSEKGALNKQEKFNEVDGERLIDSFITSIEVQPIKKSQLIKINFISYNPEFASQVTNTIANEYINFTLESKLGPTQLARKRLEDQVEAMREKLEDSERHLNDYVARSQIILLGKQGDYESILTQKLTELSKELDKETANRISKQAIYQEVRKSDADYSFVLENPLIQSLKEEYTKLESKYFNLSNVFKPEYPAMLRLEKEIENLKNRIEIEEQKIINALESDYNITLKKETSLSSAIETLRKDVLVLQQQMIQYQMLKREVDTNKELYTSLLTRLKEVDVSTTLSESNIQILDRAEIPLSPFKPKKAQNIGLSLIVGLLGGVFLAFFVEYFDNSIRTADVIEKKSHLPVIGLVPISRATSGELIRSFNSNDIGPFAEAFRTIGTYIKFTSAFKPPRQILITSPMEQDGKTTLVVNLAKSLVELWGKGIVVDADLRRPCIHSYFGVDNSTGLSSFLSGTIEYDGLIRKIPDLGIDFITAGPVPTNPSELLNSSRMRELINILSSTYDYLIIDSPPVLGLSDTLILSTFIESVVIVVKASNTPKDALTQAIKHLKGVNAKMLGVVLNGLNMQTRYGYSNYYTSYREDKKGNG